jgi:hypothetical protein
MIEVMYAPTRRRFESQSEVTNKLIKRKRILENFGGTIAEWLTLAEDFLADESRANYAYCMTEFRRLGGEIEAPQAFAYKPAETETPDWMERQDLK